MRFMALLVGLFAVLIGTGFFVSHSIEQSTGRMAGATIKIERFIHTGEWKAASREYSVLEKTWVEQKKWWPIVLDHQEIDNIDFSMARAGEYIKAKNADLALGETAVLKQMFRHLPEKESISIKNIL